jgi:YesN/AraC family two-component response regulator
MIRDLLCDVLEDVTPNIFQASNGLEGLKVIEDNQIDIILTDISMPKMNGDEMFYQLNVKKFQGEVIFLTAFADKSLVQKVMRDGAFDVIDKPIKEEILLSRIGHAIDKIISQRHERQFFETVSSFLDYTAIDNYSSLDYEKRTRYLEGLLAILQLKNENKKSKHG